MNCKLPKQKKKTFANLFYLDGPNNNLLAETVLKVRNTFRIRVRIWLELVRYFTDFDMTVV